MPKDQQELKFLSIPRCLSLGVMALIAIPHAWIVWGAADWISKFGLPGEPGKSALFVCWAAGIAILDLVLLATWSLIPADRQNGLWLLPPIMLVGTIMALPFGQLLRPVLFALAK